MSLTQLANKYTWNHYSSNNNWFDNLTATTEFLLQVFLGGDLYCHLCVFKHPSDKPEFKGLVIPKAKDDPIKYFWA